MSAISRRQLLASSVCAITQFATGRRATAAPQTKPQGSTPERSFKTSLSERSLTQTIVSGEVNHLDFSRLAREKFQFEAVDYVSSLFRDQLSDDKFLSEMNKRAADHGVRQILLIADKEGELGHVEAAERQRAIKQHRLTIDAAQALGCRGVCVQLRGAGMPAEVAKRLEESLRVLVEYSQQRKLIVLATNCSGYSHDPLWLAKLVRSIDSKGFGAFPYFDAFGELCRYKGMSQLMKVSQGVCATAKSFDEHGNETETDYQRMLHVIGEAGYRGYVSVEYRGKFETAFDGIRATQKLISQYSLSEKS